MRILALLIILTSILLPSSAIAAPFTVSPLDKSRELLGDIFGHSIGGSLSGAPNPALTRMFEMFNVVVITIGTIIVSHIGVVSTINTAQEGKTMGRKGNFWIPLRATLGMLLIVPTPSSGYSIVQSTVMWLILQGVGAADQVWNGVLADLASGIAISAAIQKPKDVLHPVYVNLASEGDILTRNLLRSAVCMLTIQNIGTRYANGSSDYRHTDIAKYGPRVNRYMIDDPDNLSTPDQASYSGSMYIGFSGVESYFDICGKYHISTTVNREEWEHPESVNQAMLKNKAFEIYSTKKEALRTMFANLVPLAQAIVAETATPRGRDGRLRQRVVPESMQPAGYKNHGIKIYTESLTALVKPQYVSDIQEIVRVGQRNGWISAGSFYFALNHAPEKLKFFDDVMVAPIYSNIPICNNAADCTVHYPEHSTELTDKLRNATPMSEHTFVATKLWDAEVYLKYDNRSVDQSIVRELKRQPGAKESALQRDVTTLFAKAISEKNLDPMIAQGMFGAQLMKESEDLWKNELHAQQALVNRVSDKSTAISDEMRELINQATSKGATFLTVYGIIWICGATMAIYIPLIPYMMFTVAVLGWFLLVIEAIVAAPILALSFILPAGEELGKIMQGLMLLLNIVLRPTLMLFGFILASRLYKAIVQLVNFSMLGNFSNISLHESLFASVAIVCLYVMFILALSNKCFALIYALPDKVLRWMGGQAEHTDATQELQQAKGGMSKGGETVNKISTGFAETGFDRLHKAVKHKDDPTRRGR